MNMPVQRSKKRSGFLRIVVPLCIVAGAILGAQVLIASRPSVSKDVVDVKPTLVAVRTVQIQDELAWVIAYGTVQAHQQLMVEPEVSGGVVQLNPKVMVGGILAKGDPLLRIDPRDYQVEVDQQTASLAKADFDLQVERGNQAVAQREWALLEPSIRPVNELSRQLALRQPHLKEKQIALNAAKSRLRKAQFDLKRTLVRSPLNALVLQEAIEIGQRLSPGVSVATLVGTDEFRVQVSVPIPELEWLTFPREEGTKGSRVRIIRTLGHGEPLVRHGHVVALLGDLTTNGRMAQVLVSIPDPLDLTKPGGVRRPLLLDEYVRVEIEGPMFHNVAVVPREVIRENQKVWIKTEKNQLEIRPVNIIQSRKDTVVVSRGLTHGEEIITSQLPAAIPGLVLRTLTVPSSSAVFPSELEPLPSVEQLPANNPQ